MINKLSTKQKEYLLMVSAIVLLVISYQLAFKKTIEQWQVNQRLKEELIKPGERNVQPGYLKRKVSNQEEILKCYRVDSAQFRNNVISTISVIAGRENVKLLEVPAEDPAFHTDKFSIQKLVFQGDYFTLVKTLRRLQEYSGTGVIRSVALKLPARGQSSELKQPLMEMYFIYAK